MRKVLHIDVAKVTGCYSNVLSAKDLLSPDGVQSPEVPIRVDEIEYGTYPKIKVDYVPIFSEDIDKVLGADWKALDFIVSSCPAGSVTYGDLDDPNSEVSRIRAQGDFETLPASYGASAPDVYYSNLPGRLLCGEVIFANDRGAGAVGIQVRLLGGQAEKRTATRFVTQRFPLEPGSHVDLGVIVLEPQ